MQKATSQSIHSLKVIVTPQFGPICWPQSRYVNHLDEHWFLIPVFASGKMTSFHCFKKFANVSQTQIIPIAFVERFTVTWLVWTVLKPVPKWIISFS